MRLAAALLVAALLLAAVPAPAVGQSGGAAEGATIGISLEADGDAH